MVPNLTFLPSKFIVTCFVVDLLMCFVVDLLMCFVVDLLRVLGGRYISLLTSCMGPMERGPQRDLSLLLVVKLPNRHLFLPDTGHWRHDKFITGQRLKVTDT